MASTEPQPQHHVPLTAPSSPGLLQVILACSVARFPAPATDSPPPTSVPTTWQCVVMIVHECPCQFQIEEPACKRLSAQDGRAVNLATRFSGLHPAVLRC